MRLLFLLILLLVAALLAAGTAGARMHAGPNMLDAGHRLKSAAVVDGMATSLSAAYSFRKVRSSYVGPAVKLYRVSGGAVLDVGFTASGDFDIAAAAAHCTTACWIETWYDQSGNGRHASREAGAGPAYVPNCLGTLPCARASTGGDYLRGPSVTWTSVKTSFSAVANRSSGPTLQCIFGQKGANNVLGTAALANSWTVSDLSTNSITMPAADNAWHAGVGVIDAAASAARVDGTEIAGVNITGFSTAGTITVNYAPAGATCSMAELFIWDGYAVSLNERAALTQNQRDYWLPLPLDTFATPAAVYSMRRLKSTYAGPAIRLRRASDNAEQDIGFLGFTGFTGAPLDTVAANAHCAATTCSIVAWYDQSGNARHALLQGAEVPPAYVANCLPGGLPCARTTGDQRIYASTPFAATLPVTFSAVGNRGAGLGGCNWPSHFGANSFASWSGPADSWVLVGGVSGYVNVTAADNAWHAGVGVINGASSVVRIDATETTGATTGSTVSANLVAMWGAAATTCSATEVIAWHGYGATAAERAALTANQRNFWGLP